MYIYIYTYIIIHSYVYMYPQPHRWSKHANASQRPSVQRGLLCEIGRLGTRGPGRLLSGLPQRCTRRCTLESLFDSDGNDLFGARLQKVAGAVRLSARAPLRAHLCARTSARALELSCGTAGGATPAPAPTA